MGKLYHMDTDLYNRYNGNGVINSLRHYLSKKIKADYTECTGCEVYNEGYCYVVLPGKHLHCPCQKCIVKIMCKYYKKMSCDQFSDFMGRGNET